jgi:hypothetical protein
LGSDAVGDINLIEGQARVADHWAMNVISSNDMPKVDASRAML